MSDVKFCALVDPGRSIGRPLEPSPTGSLFLAQCVFLAS